ncbi:PLP-dependent aminotransferase family protein [Roseomonas sp. 18066]|uniref:MocR-like pyridoxine biosynthesis transcription factor PdxR n=1 Tax=Roseomonas sp. 18066 TaxID=2681412 RepID=UPI0013588B01|nr:PLP-dependent aminotransferase family protein [Roseomonas sp. 18066]
MPRLPAPPLWNSFALDPAGGLSRQEQIVRHVRQAVLSGALRPGDRLPSTRQLAEELGLARQTVVLAFDRLLADGFLVMRPGAGTFVPATLPLPGPEAPPVTTPDGPAPRLSARGERIRSLPLTPLRREPGLLAPGLPALEGFPWAVWGRLSARLWRGAARDHLAYSDPAGLPVLRQAIAAHLGATRGLVCTPEDIVVTSGSQQGIDLAARLLLDPGDAAWVEDPGYVAGRSALEAAGARLVPVPVDAEGIVVAEGRARAPGARLALVSPAHQYPLGVGMSLARRLALLDWAAQSGAWIVEDDYDGDFRYGGAPLRPLRALGAGQAERSVLHLGTFAKILAPGLRLGFLVAPRGTAEAFTAARALVDRQPPGPAQAVLAAFIAEGHLAAHLRRMRALAAERRGALLAALERHAADDLDWGGAGPEMGLHLAARLTKNPPPGFDQAVQEAARARGLQVPALSRYAVLPGSTPQGLVLGYGTTPTAQIDAAVQRLVAVIRALRRHPG